MGCCGGRVQGGAARWWAGIAVRTPYGHSLDSTGAIVATATPLRVVLCPVLSEFWRPQGEFSFGIRSEVVEARISTTIPAGTVSSQTSATPPCTETNILFPISPLTP